MRSWELDRMTGSTGAAIPEPSADAGVGSGVRSSSELDVERNGLPHRSARHHVLLIFCFPFFSVFWRRSYLPRARHNTPFKPCTRHNVATTR